MLFQWSFLFQRWTPLPKRWSWDVLVKSAAYIPWLSSGLQNKTGQARVLSFHSVQDNSGSRSCFSRNVFVAFGLGTKPIDLESAPTSHELELQTHRCAPPHLTGLFFVCLFAGWLYFPFCLTALLTVVLSSQPQVVLLAQAPKYLELKAYATVWFLETSWGRPFLVYTRRRRKGVMGKGKMVSALRALRCLTPPPLGYLTGKALCFKIMEGWQHGWVRKAPAEGLVTWVS